MVTLLDADPAVPLRPAKKLALVREIVLAYVSVRRRLRDQDLSIVVAGLRMGSGPNIAEGQDRDARLRNGWRLGQAVGRTLRWVPGNSLCLVQSLVLTKLLARRGLPSSLVIGVRTKPDFLAHAWVEHEGEPLLPTTEQYERLMEI